MTGPAAAQSLPPSIAAFAQFPLARWSEIGPAPALCGRGRFMVPDVEHLDTVATIRDLLSLAILRGVGRRTWLRHAPLLRGGLADLPELVLERAYGYALRASGARAQLLTFSLPTAPRLLPFLSWISLESGPHACHVELHGRSARTGDPLWSRYFQPLGYDCTCYVAPVNLAKARRQGAPELDLVAEDLERLAPAGWIGEPPPVDDRDELPARDALARAEELLAAAGLKWPQSPELSSGASRSR